MRNRKEQASSLKKGVGWQPVRKRKHKQEPSGGPAVKLDAEQWENREGRATAEGLNLTSSRQHPGTPS